MLKVHIIYQMLYKMLKNVHYHSLSERKVQKLSLGGTFSKGTLLYHSSNGL